MRGGSCINAIITAFADSPLNVPMLIEADLLSGQGLINTIIPIRSCYRLSDARTGKLGHSLGTV